MGDILDLDAVRVKAVRIKVAELEGEGYDVKIDVHQSVLVCLVGKGQYYRKTAIRIAMLQEIEKPAEVVINALDTLVASLQKNKKDEEDKEANGWLTELAKDVVGVVVNTIAEGKLVDDATLAEVRMLLNKSMAKRIQMVVERMG